MYMIVRTPRYLHRYTRLAKNCRAINNCTLPYIKYVNQLNAVQSRCISLSNIQYEKEPLKPSSKVEASVQELKKKQQEQLTPPPTVTTTAAATPVPPTAVAPEAKKSLGKRIVDEILHYYHGFRLLGIDVKISGGLVWRVLNGNTLNRREYNLLKRTVGDLFRLVPFSVFIIVPFMEILLPVFIKFFPGMLPSTFQTVADKDEKIKQNLKIKLEMAKFLQGTLDDMSVQHTDRYSESAKEFSEWFHKVRSSGEQVSNEEIMKYSKLFEDELTLDALTRSQLVALCRVLEVQTLGTNNILRFQLRMKLRSLAADDKMIQKEGVHSLTLAEVQQACRARGMRAYGLSETRVRTQLTQWLDLSLDKRVPPSLLLLSSTLMLPETIPTSDKLKATISSLPETIVTQAKAAIGEKEGKIDNKVKIEVLKEEEKKMREERRESELEKAMIDKAPVISATTTPILEDTAARISIEKLEKARRKDEEHLQAKDLELLENAIDTVSKEKKLLVEKGEIEELKAEMADYKEDVEDLQKVVATQPKPEIRETKAAKRLYKSVNKIIGHLDTVLVGLEKKEEQLKRDLEVEVTDVKRKELLKIDDIMAAIKQIKDVPDQSRIDYITKVLQKMDDDRDGSLKVEDVLKVIEIIGKENVKLTGKQVDELIELIDKEEILEVEDKIEKALQKDNEDVEKLKAEKERLVAESKAKTKSQQGLEEGVVVEEVVKKTKPISKSDSSQSTPYGVVPPPPPVNSIDKTSTKNSSKID